MRSLVGFVMFVAVAVPLVAADAPAGNLPQLARGLPFAAEAQSTAWTGSDLILAGGYIGSRSASSQVARGDVTTDAVVRFHPADQTSMVVAHLPSPRGGAAAVWSGQAVFIFAGSMDSTHYSDSILRYDPATNEVQSMRARLPTGRDWLSAVWDPAASLSCPQGCAYLFGGAQYYEAFTDILRYDPVGDQVTIMPTSLPSPRAQTAAVWDPFRSSDCPTGCAYIVGGHYRDYNLGDVLRYDPVSGAISNVATLPVARGDFALAWDGQHAYIFGGHVNEAHQFLADILQVTPSTGEVKAACGVLPEGRAFAAAAWAGDRAFVLGGATLSREPTDSILSYQPAAAIAVAAGAIHIEPFVATGCLTQPVEGVRALPQSANGGCSVLPPALRETDGLAVTGPNDGVSPLRGKALLIEVPVDATCQETRYRIDVQGRPDVVGSVHAHLGNRWVDLQADVPPSGDIAGLHVYEAGYDAGTGRAFAVLDRVPMTLALAATTAPEGTLHFGPSGGRALTTSAPTAWLSLALLAVTATGSRRRRQP